MGILHFDQIPANTRQLGGKAGGLALLSQGGFAVPTGIILTSSPTEAEHVEILRWWEVIGHPSLAVRSSAAAEDSATTSFAGQNRSFLNISTSQDLKKAILDCFDSSHREASLAYRQHFLGNSDANAMNVVVQKMVQAQFAGVFFSQDPRTGKGWLLEVIAGLGEDLVSGKVTPGQYSENGQDHNLPSGFKKEWALEIAHIGQKVAQYLKFPVDMEWAIDEQGSIFVLQARPITTLDHNLQSSAFVSDELLRIKKESTPSTVWDGQTFAEWNGLPSPFTFSVWQKAFSAHHAFGDALHKLGYVSFEGQTLKEGLSLLENIFGRAYINLEKMADLYYGPIPYSIVAHPRPHTRFDFRKISFSVVAHMPSAIWSMLKVAWNVSSQRKSWLEKSSAALNQQRTGLSRPLKQHLHDSSDVSALQKSLLQEVNDFTQKTLLWPLLLVVLTESTIQNLRMILAGVLGSAEADKTLREWMAAGIHTVTLEMSEQMQEAAADPSLQALFLAKYGHRGPGEMDLAKPRWLELGPSAFKKSSSSTKPVHKHLNVEDEIKKLKSFKRDIILEEWRLFRNMLEHREQWKMEILKPYAEIRFLLSALGEKIQLGEDIHFLNVSEVATLSKDIANSEQEILHLKKIIGLRKKQQDSFRSFSFPEILSLTQLESAVQGDNTCHDSSSFSGEALSPGLAYGEVRFVQDPSFIDLESWPSNVILVAEATDPGWTPLFVKAKGIIVEHGGVLSHCAIVAREMSIPSVSGLANIKNQFKDGDLVWVDGNTGQVRREGIIH